MSRHSVELQTKIGELVSVARQPSFSSRLTEISMFFDGADTIHQAMRRVVNVLEQSGVAYTIIGGMAVNAHRHSRTTQDVDFLVQPAGLAVIRQLVTNGTLGAVPGRARRFIELSTGVRFDVLVTGAFPGSGDPGPIAFPDPSQVSETIDDLRVVNLKTLIELKLAAHRYQDLADVVNLIRSNSLDESFAEQLHPSVRGDFTECVEEMRREEEYDRRRGQ